MDGVSALAAGTQLVAQFGAVISETIQLCQKFKNAKSEHGRIVSDIEFMAKVSGAWRLMPLSKMPCFLISINPQQQTHAWLECFDRLQSSVTNSSIQTRLEQSSVPEYLRRLDGILAATRSHLDSFQVTETLNHETAKFVWSISKGKLKDLRKEIKDAQHAFTFSVGVFLLEEVFLSRGMDPKDSA